MDSRTLQTLVTSIADGKVRADDIGCVVNYIPELAAVDARQFALAITTPDGTSFVAGDVDTAFSIQSVSKVFALTLALGKVGDQLWSRVGREPSGSPFNSIVQLEHEQGIPRNPFINAGAIVLADVNLSGYKPREAIAEFVRFVRHISSDDSIVVDDKVAASEKESGYRNLALANYMRAFGNLNHSVDLVLGTYTHQCSVMMNCRQLAAAGRFLMLDGRHPNGARVISSLRARRILALMLTCGLYDASGDFAFRIGIPAKSGVGGGILAIVPGVASIAVWSPGLDHYGNSLLGIAALQELADQTDWSVFAPRQHR